MNKAQSAELADPAFAALVERVAGEVKQEASDE